MAAAQVEKKIELEPSRVDIWRVDLNVDEKGLLALKELLSPEELSRFERFRSDDQKRRFAAARGNLRRILARYTGERPQDLVFEYGEQGKPELSSRKVRFNLAHSGDAALLAVTKDKAVGIDIERIKDLDYAKIAKHYFSKPEFENIVSLPEDKRKPEFYRAWTRKEAYAKARGGSILQHLNNNDKNLDWFIADLEMDESHIAAVAVKGKEVGIQHHICES